MQPDSQSTRREFLQGKAAGVLRGLREMATKHGLTGAKKKTLAKVCGYLDANLERMHYDEYLKAEGPEGVERLIPRVPAEKVDLAVLPELSYLSSPETALKARNGPRALAMLGL